MHEKKIKLTIKEHKIIKIIVLIISLKLINHINKLQCPTYQVINPHYLFKSSNSQKIMVICITIRISPIYLILFYPTVQRVS
jgi:hypothetical protein